VLYLHGGAMIVGSVPIFDGPVSRYVARSGVSMLSLEYRLAPEHPHPTPVEDAYAGLVWLTGHAAELGIDPSRIAIMGDSAGGGVAAGVAILSRDRKGPALARQLLIYPMLDDRTTTPDPYIAPLAGWSYDDNVTAWNALLGTGHEHREIDPSAAPGRLADATGLPPAYIEVGQLDIFRDEDIRYALTLSGAGVPVELHLHPGVPHEYDAIAFDADVSRRTQSDRDRVLRSL
jgi:acetyl esterase/lipase